MRKKSKWRTQENWLACADTHENNQAYLPHSEHHYIVVK